MSNGSPSLPNIQNAASNTEANAVSRGTSCSGPRPRPTVRRLRSDGGCVISISQRDDTVMLDAGQARQLAWVLLRAAHA